MALRLPDKWVWDFWLAHHGGQHHIFYLQAPRSLSDPDLRHHHASVGHAVSADLTSWTVLPDALRPGPDGSWDDLAIWTGSVIEHDSRWHMLYTGISRADGGLIQRIGLAVSDDLMTWRKHSANPVLEADGRWYEVLDLSKWCDQSWRDPWLFHNPGDGAFHALITARAATGAPDGRGVIGHARSRDLVHWEVLAPLTSPGEFAQVEVPQLVRFNGRHHILFSARAEDHSRRRRHRLGPGQSGTFTFRASTAAGPYQASDAPVVSRAPRSGTLYAGKLIEARPGDWRFLAFCLEQDGAFAGELTDPLPVRQGRIGNPEIRPEHAGRADGRPFS
jgi:beta-fructofuranosidase